MKEEQPKNCEGNMDGKTRGGGRREFGKKKFAGKLGTDNEKAIGSIANVDYLSPP